MLTLTSRKSLIIWIAILSTIGIILVLPIKISYNLFVKGKILPANEWIIYKGTDGRSDVAINKLQSRNKPIL